MLLGFYKNADNHGSEFNNLKYTLPVVAVPRFLIDKIKALGYDYRNVIDGTIQFDMVRGNICTSESKDVRESITDIIGYNDTRALYLINRHMNSRSGGNVLSSIYDFKVGDYYSEVDKSRADLLDVMNMMKANTSDCDYEFTVSSNSVFIIMNDSFFNEPDKVYRNMSRDLCEYMLDFIDERFIFQSEFYKVISFTE